MADIVVLYAAEDRDAVARLVNWLESQPWTYWWDQKIGAGSWNSEVEKRIRSAKCVLPVWSSASAREGCELPNEVNFAKELNIPRVHVKIEPLPLPLFVSLEVATAIDPGHPRADFTHLERRLRTVLAGAGPVAAVARPPSLVVGGKEVALPVFVRSVSSHETIGLPHEALLALELHPASDPILVSAFDLHDLRPGGPDSKGLQVRRSLERLSARGCALVLDSGNYEAYRRDLGASQVASRKANDTAWTIERYTEIAKKRYPFDIMLSFDDPLQGGEVGDAVERTIELFRSAPQGGGSRVLVPVVHLPRNREGRRASAAAEVVVRAVVDALDPAIVAIPERELGDGILARVRTVAAIRRSLSRTGKYPLLHLLGTGNPLSILLLAAAGADLFDGLEWCRIVADRDTGRLHHPQHFDFFAEGMKFSEFEDVREMAADEDYPFLIKLLVHNIDFFHAWMEEVRDRLGGGDAAGMVADYLGEPQAESIRAACPGVFQP